MSSLGTYPGLGIIFITTNMIIYGQAFVSGDSLIQDQILFAGDKQSENTVVLIPNIWEDLMSISSKAKKKKNYWYWEVDMTDTEDVDRTVKVKISCPKPGPELFNYDFVSTDSDSEWTKFWKEKMRKTEESLYNSKNGLQSKEIKLPGSKWINQNGEVVETTEIEHTRDGLGDIQNLLFNLY